MNEIQDLPALAQEPELAPDRLASRLSRLVATRSVNGIDAETELAHRIATMLEPAGLELTFVETLPGRHSLAAVLRGGHDGPRLILNGHLDTVPAGEDSLWTAEPFGGEIRDGAVWGRGSVDMKAGLACQIACALVLAQNRPRLRGSLILHFAVGEEVGEPGTTSLLEAGFGGELGIVTEPTGLRVARAMRGVAYFQITIHGRSAHAGCAHLGRNPLAALGELLPALAEYERRIGARTHPLLDPLTCTPTMARAGVQQNAVPDVCSLVVDRRMLPGETVAGVLGELRGLVAAAVAPERELAISVEQIHHAFEPCEIDEGSPLVGAALDAVERVTGERHPTTGTPYGSDVHKLVNDAGIPAITLGPGDIARAHAIDERIEIDQLAQGARAITLLASRLLGPAGYA